MQESTVKILDSLLTTILKEPSDDFLELLVDVIVVCYKTEEYKELDYKNLFMLQYIKEKFTYSNNATLLIDIVDAILIYHITKILNPAEPELPSEISFLEADSASSFL